MTLYEFDGRAHPDRRGARVPARRASRRRPRPSRLLASRGPTVARDRAHARPRGPRRRAAVRPARDRGRRGDRHQADARDGEVEARRAQARRVDDAARGRSRTATGSSSARSSSSSCAWRTRFPTASRSSIETPAGRVLHTGDWKLDHTPVDGLKTDVGKLAAIGNRGVDLMLGDSTNAERPGNDRLRAARRRGVPAADPDAHGTHPRRELRLEHPPHAAGSRGGDRERPQGGARRPVDAEEHEHRAEPRLRQPPRGRARLAEGGDGAAAGQGDDPLHRAARASRCRR